MSDRLAAIIFDMDGVLCDSEPLIRAAAQAMFAEVYGVSIADAAFTPYVGAGEDRFIGGPGADHGVSVCLPRDKDDTYRRYLEMIPGRLVALPGVVSVVHAARAAGVPIAVASAADRVKVEGNLAAIGLGAEAFDAIVTGSDVANKKPAPDGFLLAAQRLGIAPAQCTVVEDAINGVQAAVAAGMPALGLTTSFAADSLVAAGATWTAAHLGDAPAEWLARCGLTLP